VEQALTILCWNEIMNSYSLLLYFGNITCDLISNCKFLAEIRSGLWKHQKMQGAESTQIWEIIANQ
jgi:hypothetical protein